MLRIKNVMSLITANIMRQKSIRISMKLPVTVAGHSDRAV
jgi:hypothetical protein